MPSPPQVRNQTGLSHQLQGVTAWLARALPKPPPPVEAKTRLLLLDTLGCALAGLAHPEVRAYADGLQARGSLSVPGFPPALAPIQLGQIMAVAACWDEACEGLARAHGRPGLHAVPAAMANGLAAGATLGEVLAAVIAGYEIGARLGAALRIRPRMHVDGTWGTIAAAVAARAVATVDAGALADALEAAACMIPASLYAPVRDGATLRNLYAGQAVARGMEAVLALDAGIAAPREALDAAAAILFERRPASDLVPASTWLILEGYFKPFAAVRHVHYGAQAALDWRARHGDAAKTITALHLASYPEALIYCGNRAPTTGIQAQFSLSYGVAHALVRGPLGPAAYRPDALRDPEIARLEGLLCLSGDDVFPTGRGARLTVTADGEEASVDVDTVPGDPETPMPADAVLAKFDAYAGPRLGSATATKLANAVMDKPLDTPISRVIAP